MLAELQADDPRQVGPYRLLGRLGSGGMGRVYLGRSAGRGPGGGPGSGAGGAGEAGLTVTGPGRDPGHHAAAISASGSWAAAGQVVTGPDGYAQPAADNYFNVADLGACATCASTQAPHWGALISYTGTSPPPAGSYTSTAVAPETARIALAGSQSTGVPAQQGELWLAFNDDAYTGSTAGNSGQVTVTITVTRA